MLLRLLALFVLVPMVELALLVWMGSRVGFWPTIALVVLTGTVGALLMRGQGARAFRAIRGEMADGRVPAAELLDGLLVLVGGVMLLTPGPITDLAGIALLVPPTRRRVRAALRRRLERAVREGRVTVLGRFGPGGPFGPSGPAGPL